MSEGRKPKLPWVWSSLGMIDGFFYPEACSDISNHRPLEVRVTMPRDGKYYPWVNEWGRLQYLPARDTLEDAQLACEDWLASQIRPYLPAARALGLFEPSEEEIADAARALKENGVNLSTMDRSALERRVLELYARFRKEEQSK